MKSLSHPFIFEKVACIIDGRNPVSFLRSLKLLVYCPNSIPVVCQFLWQAFRIKIQASSSIYRSRRFATFIYGLRHILLKKNTRIVRNFGLKVAFSEEVEFFLKKQKTEVRF